MEDLKWLTESNNVLQLSKALQKIEKAIELQIKDPTKKESAIEELNFLREQCLSNNVQLGLLSTQTLYSLVESNVLQPASVLTMFITMLSNANTPMKISIITEGIINILVLDLQVTTLQLKPNQSYSCPFGLKTAQHPIITIMCKKNVDILDMACKLHGIINHENEHIRCNSIEFLRPVFLYALCNPIQIPNAGAIWSVFLKQRRLNKSKTQNLLEEIFIWCRITPDRCLSLSTQLMETIEVYLEANDNESAFECQIYLLALILSLIEYGYDPRNALDTISRTIQQSDAHISDENYVLITISQIVHNIAPFYLRSVLEIIKILFEKKRIGNRIIRNMVLDSLIIRLAVNGKNISAPVAADIERLIKKIRKHNAELKNICPSDGIEDNSVKNVQYLHPAIAMNFNLARTSTELCLDDPNNERLKRFISFVKANKEFANEMHTFLRSILLSTEDLVLFIDILEQLLASAKDSSSLAAGTIFFIFYLLAKETEGRKQLELLRGLTSFTAVKENIPLILNTYRSLSLSSSAELQIISIDLHTRLWLAEKRTYQFLHKALITDDEKLSVSDRWEMNVVKANTIKEICSEKTHTSSHGKDLVAPLSKILNSLENDLASALALNAVVWLCKSHTVNIVSTWKVLRRVFESELKPRTTKSLCEFFGEVPTLKSPSNEYDFLFYEALTRLWKLITDSKDVEIIRAALRALRNFDFAELTLKHVPNVLYDQVIIPREYQIQIAASHNDPNNAPMTMVDVVPYIPGECLSIELFRNINQQALGDAIEFVTHLVETEMSQFRSGVYHLAEGRPEPKELQHLHARSQLRAMTKYLREQSEHKSEPATAIKCLKCVAGKYSRPIPPLNWFFLIEYINNAMRFDGSTVDDQLAMKKYALIIAGNQIAHSGSAKTIVENYLQSFDVRNNDLEEVQIALELVARSCDGVSPRILAAFLRDTLNYVYRLSASSQFEEKCHLEMGLAKIMETFDKKCLVSENVDIIIDEFARLNEILPKNSKIYDKYSKYALKLPSESLDRLSTPDGEWTSDNFRKSLALRIKAVSNQKEYPNGSNPYMWLNLLIDNAFDLRDPIADAERKEDLLMAISNLFMERRNERFIIEWIMYFLGKVQSNLSSSEQNIDCSLFSLDLYMFCIVMASGCAAFITDDKLSMSNRMQWLNTFPEALWLLSKRPSWDKHMPRIFEFLYHLKTQQNSMPKEYNSIICNTLICGRNHEFFLQKTTWNKFISLK